MKTAMQQLIESLQAVKKELNTKWDGDPLARQGIVIAINEANNLLDKEKEQIIDAYIQGYTSWDSEMSGFEYYTQTHNKNK